MIVYDISQINTFNSLSKWLDDIKSTRGKEVLLVVVGNKADLEEARFFREKKGEFKIISDFNFRQVPTEIGEQKSLEMEALFFEVSAKTGDNISNMFNMIAGSLPTIDTSHISTPTTHSSELFLFLIIKGFVFRFRFKCLNTSGKNFRRRKQ